MDAFTNPSTQINSALFIDFDNIYITLEDQDKAAAEKFATAPDRWLNWLERQLPMDYPGTSFSNRRILIRRCYLNPNSFSEHRLNFIRAACEVIDCPPLTAGGKTSTDIHMVMDMLEALGHDTYFHEFIILSGDADFTPLLLKLRKHARFSAVLSVGYASPAYRASSDHLIKVNAFIETALGVTYQDEHEEETLPGNVKVDQTLLKSISDRVFEAAVQPTGVPANDLPAIYKKFSEFKQSNHWLGFRSLKNLTQAVVERHGDLVVVEDDDSWFVTRKIYANWLYSSPEEVDGAPVTHSPKDLRGRINSLIQSLVRESPTPIALNVLAHSIQQKFQDQIAGSNWLSAGTFKNLLLQLELDGLKLSSEGPSYLYDPARHSAPVQGQEQEQEQVPVGPSMQDIFSNEYPSLAPLAQKIHRLTDMPYLMPEHFGLLFNEIAREVNERGYQLTRTSRTVRDRCIERGAPIARSHVNFILTGLYFVGYRLGSQGPESPQQLGEKLVENTIKLCQTSQVELSEEEIVQVREWLLSRIENGNGA